MNGNSLVKDTHRVFQLLQELPRKEFQEAICHRLEMLSAVVEVMSRADITPTDTRLIQRYAWAIKGMADQLKELFYATWDQELIQ